MKPTKYIWKNNELIPWEEANTHVLTHALHYGTAVFEGIRAYDTDQGTAIFRAKEHYERLINSAKIYNMKPPYTEDALIKANKLLIKENNLKSCYIRPIFYCGYGEMGLYPGKNPIDTVIAAWEWGTYLGEEGLKNGVRCKVSSWARPDSRTLPPLAKCTANYANSVLAKLEAVNCGYDEAILLNINGTIAEGPGENIFMIKDSIIYTTQPSDSTLQGITCMSAIEIAKDLGYQVKTKSITRDELFIADELFFSGTAAEVTPIKEIDNRIIKSNGRGPITEKIQAKFFQIVQGKDPKYHKWLALVNEKSI